MSFAWASVATCAHGIVGQPGTLDTAWNGTGTVVTVSGDRSDATAMTLQPDGKVLLAGSCLAGTRFIFCAMRYLPNGMLDTTWNGTGKVFTPISSTGDRAGAMTLQPDGKVLLAGQCDNVMVRDFCSVRYLPNGSLDATWNGTGKVITTISGSDSAYAMSLQPDGKVLLAGSCEIPYRSFCAVRYLANGTLDTTWNGTGKVITTIGGSDSAYAMSLQPDGKVLLAGHCEIPYRSFCAVRYLANGTLDTTWNGTGKAIDNIGSNYDRAYAIALQPDGNVLLAGFCYDGRKTDFCSLRYLPNGTLDLAWGRVITPVGGASSVASAIALQPDGKVLMSGSCAGGFCAVRYLRNGAPDTTWNGTGKVITPISGGSDSSVAMILQPDGKVLLAGQCDNGTNNQFCSARYDGGPFVYQNCSPDLDGDGFFLATKDALIYTRIALGITGPAVIGGITFAPSATRSTWSLIRDYLVTQCGMSLVQ